MQCTKCNFECPENTKFCPECGEKIIDEQPVVQEIEETNEQVIENVEKAESSCESSENIVEQSEQSESSEQQITCEQENTPTNELICSPPQEIQEIPQKSPTILDEIKNKTKKGKIVSLVAIVLVIAICLSLFLILKPKKVEVIKLSSNKITLETDEQFALKYSIEPSDADDKTVTWSSSDSEVAVVSKKGVITALKEGTCTITVTSSNEDVTATCKVTVEKAKPNFKEIYAKYANHTYATVADDGSYLEIDTNPADWDSDYSGLFYSYSDYTNCIKSVHKALGISDALLLKMQSTSALQGRQNEDFDTFTVSWTYHPDSGLEIIYSLKGSSTGSSSGNLV